MLLKTSWHCLSSHAHHGVVSPGALLNRPQGTSDSRPSQAAFGSAAREKKPCLVLLVFPLVVWPRRKGGHTFRWL